MPGISGLEATKRIKDALPDVAVLILTIHEREDFLFQALQAGAQGYILKTANVPELLGAIRTVHSGEVFIYPRMATMLVGDYMRRMKRDNGQDQYRRLSAREREVLPLLAESHTNQEIAHLLHLFMLSTPTSRGESIIRQGERSWR